MTATGALILLAGIYLVVNSGSFRDVLLGKASIGFLTPGSAKSKAKSQAKANEDQGSEQLIGGNWYG